MEAKFVSITSKMAEQFLAKNTNNLTALQAAKSSVGNSFRSPVVLEFRSQLDPVILKTNGDDIKMVLPVRIKE